MVLPTPRFSKYATDMFLFKKMELSNRNMSEKSIRDWTHVLEAMLLTARLTETCLSKSNGRFSAVSSGKFGALQGESRFLLVYLVGYKH